MQDLKYKIYDSKNTYEFRPEVDDTITYKIGHKDYVYNLEGADPVSIHTHALMETLELFLGGKV